MTTTELDPELQRKVDAFEERMKASKEKEAEEEALEKEKLRQAYIERRRQAAEREKK